MTVIVTVRGSVQDYYIDEDFASASQGIQLAAANGMSFLSTRLKSGEPILLSIDDILTLQETEDE